MNKTLFDFNKKEYLVLKEDLASAGISALIKFWRLSKIERAMGLAQTLVNEKILSKDYILKRCLIFAYEDGSEEMIEKVSRAVEDFEKTAFRWIKKDSKWTKEYTGNGDMNIFRRAIFWCGWYRKRFELEWKGRKIGEQFYSRKEDEGIAWLQALDLAFEIEEEYIKELKTKGGIEIPLYVLDGHTTIGRKLKKGGFELDRRYSGDGYGNAYMELEYQKYGNLSPDREDKELEKLAKGYFKKI